MPNNQLKITSIRETMQVNPATRAAEPYMVVQFTVGAHGPFQETFLKSAFDPSTVNAKVNEFAQKLGLVTGQ